MIKELVKAILSQVCTPATTDDAQVADDLVETLTSMDGAACLAANQIGATTCIIAYLDDDDQPHVMYNPRLLQALGAFKAVEGCLSLEADSKVTRFDRIKVGYSELVDARRISTAGRRRSSSTASTTARASWSSLMGKKPNAAARPLPPAPKLNRALRGGLGPNKASGHKGGISRQGSKRG